MTDLRDVMARAMQAQGEVDPDEVFALVETIDADDGPDRHEPPPIDETQEAFALELSAAPGVDWPMTIGPSPDEQLNMDPPPPPKPDDLPEVPHGRGLTAMEAAEMLADDWRRRETLRRRAQELNNPYQMLTVIGRRPGASTRTDNHVYVISDLGRDALAAWDAGESWAVDHLSRREDPETAQRAARKIKPGVDFHRVLSLFARD